MILVSAAILFMKKNFKAQLFINISESQIRTDSGVGTDVRRPDNYFVFVC